MNSENLHDTGSVVIEEDRSRLKESSLYKVILGNDDSAPMDFWGDVLVAFFNRSRQWATKIILQAHTEAKGTCGIYTYNITRLKGLK